jgi:hypothetical protein
MSFLTGLALPGRVDAKQFDYDHNVRYEICAASERAKVLMQTGQQVNNQLHSVRTLRRQRSSNLSQSAKEWIDGAISHSSTAISTTAHVAEPVPEHTSDRRRRLPEASFLRHLRHLISDSSQVTAQLAQLSIASQSLNTAMSILLSCESQKSDNMREAVEKDRSPVLDASLQELCELMNRRRKVKAAPVDYSLLPSSTLPFSANEDFASQATTNVAGDGNPAEGLADDVFDTLIDHKLVLIIEAVEMWRKAAEEALETATQKFSEDEHTDQHSDVQPGISDLYHKSQPPLSRTSYGRCPANKDSIPCRKPVSRQHSPQLRDSSGKPPVSTQSKYLIPHHDSTLRQSYEKEAVFLDQKSETLGMPPPHKEANPTAMLGMNRDATFSTDSISPGFLTSNNHSLVSVSTNSSQPYYRSRGRAWLERRAGSLE